MKSGISSAVSEQFEYRVPPHPGPLPWGEGGQLDRARSSLNSFCKNGGLGVLPLPKGEGRGEGERWVELHRYVSVLLALMLCAGCKPPGKPTTADIELKPEEVRDFAVLYQQSCAGCHGRDGKGNSALALANPVYLAVAGDDTIRRVIASGIRGSLMPAFAKSSGGMLTDEQIEILVHEMRARWAKPEAAPGAPSYAATESGDAARGTGSFTIFCAGCHGPDGKGTAKGSSIVDDSFLALVSDQSLRTTVIAGQPDLGHPDWRNYSPDRPMTPQEVTDVVAWLVAQRTATPGQPYASNEQSQKQN